MRQRIVKGRAGSLRFLPPEAAVLGPPAAGATVEIVNDQAETVVASTAATLDAVDTVLANAVQAGPAARKLTLVSVAGIVPGRRYLLSAAKGVRLVVKVVAVQGTNVWLLTPIPVTLEGGASFQGVELAVALAADAFDDTGLHRAIWTYSIGGTGCGADQAFSVVSRLPTPSLEPGDLAPYLPQEMSRLIRSDEAPAMAGAISAAWDELLEELEDRGVPADTIMDSERLRPAHRYRALWLASSGWGETFKAWRDEKLELFAQKVDGLLKSPTTWIDKDEDEKATPPEMGASSIRLTR